MEKILCEKCKNAYLQKNEDGYFLVTENFVVLTNVVSFSME